MTKITNGSRFAPENFVANHIAELPKSGIREFFDLVNTMDDVISLGVGEPDFSSPWRVRESGIFSLEQGHTAYTSNLGLLALRREITAYLERHYHVSYNPENECLVTIGVSEALDAAMRAIINPGDEVIYTEPCFVSYPAEIRMAHGVPVVVETFEEDQFALDPERLRAAITPRSKALLINFPCNPTGAVMPLEKLRKVADIAIENDLLVITDEVYSELIYDGLEHHSIASLPGMRERTIFLHGFSKSFAMTGLRIGYACGPRQLIDPMMKIHQYSIMSAPTTAQEAAIEALRNGAADLEMMRESYWERRNVLVKGLNDMGLKTSMPKGAFYVFANIRPSGLSSREFARQLLQQERVAVIPGNAFGACGEGFVRCCYATGMNDLQRAIERMKRFVSSIRPA